MWIGWPMTLFIATTDFVIRIAVIQVPRIIVKILHFVIKNSMKNPRQVFLLLFSNVIVNYLSKEDEKKS